MHAPPDRGPCLRGEPGHHLVTEETGHGRVLWTCSCGNTWQTHTDD